MDSFLDFLTDNYTYFLIAAGVLLLALIGLIVSGKKKKKEEDVNFEETPVDNTITANEPTAVSESQPEAPTISATPDIAPVQEPASAPETITLETPTEAPKPVEPVQNINPTGFNSNVSVPPAEPVQTPDEPIVQINPVENNTFNTNNTNQNNPNSNNTL